MNVAPFYNKIYNVSKERAINVMKTLIKNIGKLISIDPLIGDIESSGIIIENGLISWVGEMKDVPSDSYKEIDAGGRLVLPGLVDCHTHLVHAGSRQNEFAMRAEGKTYQEIAEAGGGIMSTVNETRNASEELLLDSATKRVSEAFSFGTTFLEIKTGYGLDEKTEEKMLRVIEKLNLTSTYLGAHVVPAEFKSDRKKYLEIVLNQISKLTQYNSCKFVDVFVEDGAFNADEAKEIAKVAHQYNYRMKLHVDQFSDTHGGELAAELNAISADHLDETSEKGLKAMAKKNVVGVVLPGASFFVGDNFPNAKKMIDFGVDVAVASDYNPGTCPALNLVLMANIAITQCGLTVHQAWKSITLNAAKALGEEKRRGSITVGKIADLVCFNAEDENYPLYKFANHLIEWVMVGGELKNSLEK